MSEIISKIHHHFSFSHNEIKAILIASGLLGFMFTFRDFTLSNLFFSVIIAIASLFFHVAAQKIISLSIGYSADFKLWWYGLLAGLAVTFISNGKIWWLFLPGGITFSLIARQRLGKMRYGLNYTQMGIIAFSGVIASIVFGTVFKNIDLYLLGSNVIWLHKIFIFNLVLAISTMLPIPPLNGGYLFFASRMWFSFLFGTVFAYGVFTLVFEIYSWIWAIICGIIIWLVYFGYIERKLW